MSEQSEKIYINLVKNKDWKSPKDKLPVYVGPKNMKHPDKNWTIGVNINGKWYNQAAFPKSRLFPSRKVSSRVGFFLFPFYRFPHSAKKTL